VLYLLVDKPAYLLPVAPGKRVYLDTVQLLKQLSKTFTTFCT